MPTATGSSTALLQPTDAHLAAEVAEGGERQPEGCQKTICCAPRQRSHRLPAQLQPLLCRVIQQQLNQLSKSYYKQAALAFSSSLMCGSAATASRHSRSRSSAVEHRTNIGESTNRSRIQ